jgi:mannose-6-phosphate isomerase-like protein (cupin superfamily)
MPDQLSEVRRIITGHTADGVATIIEDGPTPAVITNPARPGYVLRNIWRTSGAPAPVDGPDDITEHTGVLPPANGTVLRVIDIPPDPDDPEELRKRIEAMFMATYPDADHTGGDLAADGQPPRHPGMHKTMTVDYAIVLSGEMTAIMDDCETVMRAGDILVQRGTNHAWSNRSDETARIAFVLIDGKAE